MDPGTLLNYLVWLHFLWPTLLGFLLGLGSGISGTLLGLYVFQATTRKRNATFLQLLTGVILGALALFATSRSLLPWWFILTTWLFSFLFGLFTLGWFLQRTQSRRY